MTEVLVPHSAARRGHLALAPFQAAHAPAIASWIATDEELRWVAPSTPPPVSAEKVMGWKRDDGHAYVLLHTPTLAPVAYAELNPMRRDPSHFWLGHILVSAAQRGRGLGCTLVRKLVRVAFDELRGHRVSLVVFPDNRAAIQCYMHAGLSYRGREQHQFNGCGPKYDLLRFEIGRDER